MAELVIECPTPDGHMDFQNNASPTTEPQTNSRIREFLKKHHEYRSPAGSAIDSGNSSDEQQRQLANHSPPPNCSICLGRVKSKCFTDSCMHQFCFSCLLEWSKVKPECPLCKQTFKSIIHNVTSMDSYEEYKVEVQQRHVNWMNYPFQARDVDMSLLFSHQLPNYPPMHRHDHLNRGTTDPANRRLYQLFRQEQNNPLVRRFAQTYPDEVYPTRISGTQWRQYIYNRRLYAEPLNDLSGQSRNITAEFYRANPAQLHRLMPWLHRELLCLCADQLLPTQTISYTLQRIEHLIQTYDMTSFDFLSRIRVIVPNHTDHFIHELINYARSPYDLIGYDRFVTYSPRFESDTNEIVTLSSSEEGSDVEYVGSVVNVDVADNTVAQTVASNQSISVNDNESRSNNGSNRIGSIEQAGTSGVTAAQIVTQTVDACAPNLSGDDSDEEEIKTYLQQKPNVSADEVIRGRTGPSPDIATEQTPSMPNENQNSASDDLNATRIVIAALQYIEASTSQTNDTINTPAIIPKVEPNTPNKSEVINADSGSDSDECLFVCAKKPPHLRTPEYVELNSDSDSDVVFVSENCQAPPITEITSSQLEVANDVRKSILSALSAQCSEANANLANMRRKRNRAADNATYTSQTASVSMNMFEVKPSTSEAIRQWLIQAPEEHSRRISPRSSARQRTPPIRPRLTTTIKISRGKRIYESPSSEEEEEDSDGGDTTDQDTSSSTTSNSFQSSDDESSSHEEYVCSSSRARAKRTANNDGPSLVPRKKFRKRRGKRIYESSSSENGDEADDGDGGGDDDDAGD